MAKLNFNAVPEALPQLEGEFGETVIIKEMPRARDEYMYSIASYDNPLGQVYYVTFAIQSRDVLRESFDKIFERELRMAFELYKRGLRGDIIKKQGFRSEKSGPHNENIYCIFNQFTGELTFTVTTFKDEVIISVTKQIPASAIESGGRHLDYEVRITAARLERTYASYVYSNVPQAYHETIQLIGIAGAYMKGLEERFDKI